MSITKTLKHKRTQHLDNLARESGRCYSKVISLVRKTHKKKGFWLSEGTVKKYMRLKGYALHPQSIQACAETYFDSLKSFFKVRESNPDAKPPKRTHKFFKVLWKSSAICLKDGQLILSNGKGREPVILENVSEKPKYVEMSFKRGHYCFALVYKVNVPPKQDIGITVSVDMGEIHPIVSFDGKQTTIYNGRLLRSIMQYKNKVKARFSAKMDRCKKRSKRWYRLQKAKQKTLAKLDAQIKDAEHKITSRFISDCQRAKADTIVIGELKGIRDNIKFGKKSNQKLHQWAFARFAQKICHKAELAGIKVVSVSEAYTSQTCPQCGHRKKPVNRNYHCEQCDFKYHRDGVGAINIRQKYLGRFGVPVVGTLAFPFGVRYN